MPTFHIASTQPWINAEMTRNASSQVHLTTDQIVPWRWEETHSRDEKSFLCTFICSAIAKILTVRIATAHTKSYFEIIHAMDCTAASRGSEHRSSGTLTE